jgi:Pregnancy-associated plasma protein-A/GEVED domain
MLKNILLTVLFYFAFVNFYTYGQNWGCKYDAPKEVETNKNARVAVYDPTTVHTIPVMFEIYYRNEAVGTGRNIAEQTLIDALDLVNKRFAATAPYGGQNANIRFELVKRNGNHEPSNGIKRFNMKNNTDQVQNFSDLQQFGNTNYVTIRSHDAFSAGVDGLSSPGLNAMDMRYTLFGNLNEASIVIAHELGHVFSLRHTFQGSTFDSVTNTWSCASATNDGVSDTDPHKENDTGCNPSTINSCTGTAFGTLLRNYMCYSGYSCQDQFTPLQIVRMRTEIQTYKPELLNTLFLVAPTAAEYPTLPVCTVSVPTYNNLGAPNGMGETSFTTDLGGNTYSRSNLDPVIHGAYKNFGRTRPITVTRGNTVQFTAKTWWSEKIKIYLDKNNDGVFNEATELLHNLDFTTAEPNPIDPFYFYFGFNQTITLPTDALTDTYLRLRIVTIITAENNTACNLVLDPDFGYGSVTDYSLFIKDNRPKFTMITRPHPAQSINKGENGAIVYKALITTGAVGSTIDALTLKTSGTYVAGDIANFKMYVNNMNSLTGASLVGSVSSTGGAGETLNFNQYYIPISANGGGYFIFTADINASAVTGRTIKVNGANNPIGIVTTGTQPVFVNNQTDIVGTQTIGQANFQVTGNVTNNNVNITGRVYASLIANSSIFKTVEVNNGVFNMGSLFDGNYTIVIHNTPEGSGTPSLPAGMLQWVGENLDSNPSDNLPNGALNLIVNGTTISQARVNAVRTVTFRVSPVVSVISIKTGNWEDPSTWNVGRLPLITEDVTIGSTHTITITSNNQATAKKLIHRANATLRLGNTTSKLILGN